MGSSRPEQVQSSRDGAWLNRVEDAPKCPRCNDKMYEREAKASGDVPSSEAYDVLFECPYDEHQVRGIRIRD